MIRHSEYTQYIMTQIWDEFHNFNPKYSLEQLVKTIDDTIDDNLGDFDKTHNEFQKLLSERFSLSTDIHAFIVNIITTELMFDRDEIEKEDKLYDYYSNLIDFYLTNALSRENVMFFDRLIRFMFNEGAIQKWFSHLHPSKRKSFLEEIRDGLINISKRVSGTFDEYEKRINQFLDTLEIDKRTTESPCKKRNRNFVLLISNDEESISYFLDELLNGLKRNRISKENTKVGFIHSEVAKSNLRKVFTKHNHANFKPILWTGTIDELNLFIKLMFEKKKIKRCRGKWNIAACCFILERAEKELTPGRLSRATRHDRITDHNRKALKRILDLLPG